MNRISLKDRAQIIGLLVEGNSLRSMTRITGKSINTATKLLVDVGTAWDIYQNEHLRNLPCKRVQVDEIWFLWDEGKERPAHAPGGTWQGRCLDLGSDRRGNKTCS